MTDKGNTFTLTPKQNTAQNTDSKTTKTDKITPVVDTVHQLASQEGYTWSEWKELETTLRLYKPRRDTEKGNALPQYYIKDKTLSRAIQELCNNPKLTVKKALEHACNSLNEPFSEVWAAGSRVHSGDMINRVIDWNTQLLRDSGVNLVVLRHESVSRYRPRALLNNLRNQLKLVGGYRDRISELEEENRLLRVEIEQYKRGSSMEERFIALVEQGIKPKEIQEQLGISSSTYYRLLGRLIK